MNILIVDDVPGNVKLLRAQLESEGHETTGANDGVEALAVLATCKIDVVISDILMPNMDGYRLCYEVRNTERLRDLTFLMYTATFTSSTDEQLCYDLGVDKYLRKPASVEEILQSIEHARAGTHRRPTVTIGWEDTLRQYSEQLVSKLEEKNFELAASLERTGVQIAALNAAENAIVVTNSRGVIEWLNPAFTAMTGFSPQEAIGQTPRILKSGKQDAGFYHEFWKTVSSGKTWRGEFTNHRKNGEVYYDDQTVTPVLSPDGTITHYVGIMNDVTERKRVEEELRSTHAKLAHLLSNSPAVIYALKIEGESIFPYMVSANVTELLGFEVQETMTYDWWAKQLHPDDRERAFASLSETIAQGSCTIELRMRHKDGSVRFIEDKRRLIRDADGKPVEILGAWNDITARTEMESALRASEQRLNLAMEASNVGQWDWDTETNAVFFSPEWKRQLGHEDSEIENAFFEWKDRLHPDDEEPTMVALEAFRADRSNAYDVEFRLRHKDGSYRWIHTRANFGCTDGVKQTHIFGCHVDITDRKVAEENLRTTNEQLEARVEERTSTLARTNDELVLAKHVADRANAAKSEFLSGMSHELRTPLNAILGFAQLLELDSKDERQHDSIEHILKGGRHLLDLINEILEISRIETGHIELSIEPFRVSEVVRESTLLVQPMADTAGVKLIDNTSDSTLYIRADRQRFRQVIMNLVSNAIKYNVPDGVVTVSLSSEGESVCIEIADTGLGIKPEMECRLFVPFDRLGAASGGIEGTGLGLSISRKFCEAMGGTVKYRPSPLGQGSVFTIVLPIVENVELVSGAQNRGDTRRSYPDVGCGTVLYIEDNPANVELVKTLLARFPGVSLLIATHGQQGLALAALQKPDLILLDLNLPDISGADVLKRIMSDPSLCDTPVVVLSADATSSQIRRLTEMGAYAYLTKPLVIGELFGLLGKLLTVKRPA